MANNLNLEKTSNWLKELINDPIGRIKKIIPMITDYLPLIEINSKKRHIYAWLIY